MSRVATLARGRAARIAALLAGGAALRIVLAFVVFPHQGFATDLGLFQSWSATLARVGPSHFYSAAPTADYPPGYLYVLWLVGAFSLPLKLPAIVADIVIAFLIYRAALRWYGERAALVAAALYLFIPVTWYDSALWGQVDAVAALVMLASLLLLIDGHSEAATATAALGVLVKPQDAVVFVVVLAVLVRRHLLGAGSRLRLLTSVAAGLVALIVPLLPFDITRYAPPSLAMLPVVGPVAGLGGLLATLGQRYDVLTANAYNLWSLVGPAPLASIVGTGGAWTLDSLQVLGSLSAFTVGAALLAVVGSLVALGLLVRDDRTAILLGFTVAAFAFYALPTRVHERYLFPVFVSGALLVGPFGERAAAYVATALVNTLNIHAVLASPLAIAAPGRGPGRGAPFGGVPFGRAAAGGRAAFTGVTSLRLPFADLARAEWAAGLVALAQTATLCALVALWIYIVIRSIRMRTWSAPSSSSSPPSRWEPAAAP